MGGVVEPFAFGSAAPSTGLHEPHGLLNVPISSSGKLFSSSSGTAQTSSAFWSEFSAGTAGTASSSSVSNSTSNESIARKGDGGRRDRDRDRDRDL